MQTYYNPEVKLLLINHSDKRVNVLYNDNLEDFSLPFIGPRPPFYAHPVYEPYNPII